MNENISNNLDLGNDSDFDIVISSEEISSNVSEDTFINSEEEEEERREVTSEEDQAATEGSREETSAITEYPVETLNKINTNLNTITGLLFVTLVLVGCGLIIRYIWGLLNK